MAAEASDLRARLGPQEHLEAEMRQAQVQLQAAQHEVQARQVGCQPHLVLFLLQPDTGLRQHSNEMCRNVIRMVSWRPSSCCC